MHFFTLVVLPPGFDGDVEKAVEKLMAPYDEQLQIEPIVEDGETYWTNPNSFWDWYQIGGRWTGHLSDYNPEEDPANRETCNTCDGTGTRPGGIEEFGLKWFNEMNGCNGCQGKGWRTTWPTEWANHHGDIARLGDVRERLEAAPPYYIVHEGVTRGELRNPDWDRESNDYSNYLVDNREAVVETLAKLSDDCTVVVVDCHS